VRVRCNVEAANTLQYFNKMVTKTSKTTFIKIKTRGCKSQMPTTRAASINAATRVFALVELCAIIAQHSGVVGAYRLKGVCKAALQGALEWLRTLPGLVVCGGSDGRGPPIVLTKQVWRLDLGRLRWERMPNLTRERTMHACCAVRRGVVVLGGLVAGHSGIGYS